MKLREIQEMPTIVGNMHESLYRSYHILEQVLVMVDRGDTKESIFEVVEMLRDEAKGINQSIPNTDPKKTEKP